MHSHNPPPTVCIPSCSSQPPLHPPRLAALHPVLLGGRRHHRISTSTRASRSPTPCRTAECLLCCCHLTASSAVGPGRSSSPSSPLSGPGMLPRLPCSAGCAGAARGYAHTWEEALRCSPSPPWLRVGGSSLHSPISQSQMTTYSRIKNKPDDPKSQFLAQCDLETYSHSSIPHHFSSAAPYRGLW